MEMITMTGTEDDECDDSDSKGAPSTSFAAGLQAASQLQGLRRSLLANQNLTETLASIDEMQRETAEPVRQMGRTVEAATEPIREMEQVGVEVIEPIRNLQQSLDAATQPFAELQRSR